MVLARTLQEKRLPRRSVLMTLCASVAVTIGGMVAGPAAACSIEEHGPAAYQRVIDKIPEKLAKFKDFNFAPYEAVEVTLEPDCVLRLHGSFSFKKQRNLEARVYDAVVKPTAGAPQGMKILELTLRAP